MLVTGGSTDVTTYFQMRLTAGGDGTGLTITDFDLSYTRSGAATAAKVDATALAAADSAHADNKMIEVDATDCPGLYRVDWPDAAFAAGVREVVCTVKHASCFTESLRVEIDGEVSVTEWNGVKLSTTNPLPNAAPDAAGGLPISDAGGLDMDATDANVSAILTDTAEIGVAGAGLTEAGGDGDHLTAINLPNQTMDITGDITGNLSGSVGSVTGAVGSVTGAVGSVTGNVGGNVTGTVGELAAQAKADVNAEVVDALNTDTYAEPGQGTPGATLSLAAKIGYLFKAWRNRKTQTSTTWSLYNDDAVTVDQKATVADDGTTASKTEVTTGP